MKHLYGTDNSVSRLLRTLFFSVMVLCVSGGTLWAADKYKWNGSEGDWDAQGNWKSSDMGLIWGSSGEAPINGSTIYINTDDVNSNIVIDLNDDIDCSSSTVYLEAYSGRTITINLNGNTLKLGDITFGNQGLTNGCEMHLTVNGPGNFDAASLTYKSNSTNSTIDATNGAQINCSGDFKCTNNSSSIAVKTDSSSGLNVAGTVEAEIHVNESFVWTGASSTAWSLAANWSGGVVPSSTSEVFLPDVSGDSGRFPVCSGNISVRKLTVESGATLTTTGTGKIDVSEDLKNDGTITANGTVTVSGNAELSGPITSSGSQTYSGPVVLSAPVTLNAGTSTVSFQSTVDSASSTAGSFSITAGKTEFGDSIGGSYPLENISISGNYEGTALSPVTCSGAFSIDGTAIIRGSVSAASVSITGNLSFGGATDSVTTSGDQTYSAIVSLLKTASPILLVSDNAGKVTFGGRIQNNNDGTGTAGLTVGSSTKKTDVEFAAIGGTNPVGDVLVYGNAVFNAAVKSKTLKVTGTSSVSADITTSGVISGSSTANTSQYYGGNMTVSNAVSFLAGSNVVVCVGKITGSDTALTFGSGTAATAVELHQDVASVTNLTSFGNLEVKDDKGINIIVCSGDIDCKKNAIFRCKVQGASVTVAGDTTIGKRTASVETTGNQSYKKFLINRNTSSDVFAMNAGGTIDFAGVVNGYETAVMPNVEITALQTNFSGVVGTSNPLGKITVTGDVAFGGNVVSTGAQTYNDPVVLKANVSFTAGTTGGAEKVTFRSTVDSETGKNFALTLGNGTGSGKIPADVAFEGAAGGTDLLSSVLVYGKSSFASDVHTTGNQTYTDSAILKSDVNFVAGTTGAPATVSFKAAVDSAPSENHGMTVGNGTGSGNIPSNAVFASAVGGTDALSELTVYGTSSVSGGVKSSGNQSYSSLVTLAAASTFESSSGTMTFGSAGVSSSVSSGTFDFEIKGNASVFGANTFRKLSIDNSGFASETTVAFEGGKKQTIIQISAKGNSTDEKYLTLTSTDISNWNAYFAGTLPVASDFEYTKIEKSQSVNSTGTSSKDLELAPSLTTVLDADIDSPTTIAWFTNACYWIGASDSNWKTLANWSYTDPDVSVSPVLKYPSYSDGKNDIYIATQDGKNDLELGTGIDGNDALSVKSLAVRSGKRLALGACSINAVEAMSVQGTVALYGSQSDYPLTTGAVPASIAGTSSWGNSSTIEYYGDSGSAVFPVTDVLYASLDGGVKSYKNLKVTKISGVISFENEISAVSFEDSATVTGVFKKNFVVTGASGLDLTGNWTAGDKAALADQEITVNASNSNGELKISGALIACNDENAKKTSLVIHGGKGTVVNAGTISGSNGTLTFDGNYSGTGTLNASSGNTVFNNNLDLSEGFFVHNGGTVSVLGSFRTVKTRNDGTETTLFNNLVLGSAANKNLFVTIESELFIDGNFTTYDIFTPDYACHFKGDVVAEAIINIASDAYFEGTSLQTVSGGASAVTFKNLIDKNTFEDSVEGNPSGLYLNRNVKASNVTVSSSGFLSCGSGKTLSVSGKFENGGTFKAGTSTVEFTDSGDSEITGNNTFYNLKSTVAGKKIYFESGSTQTVTKNFTVTGTAVSPTETYEKYISLLSKTEGSMWDLDCTGATVSVQRTKIQDSNNITVVPPKPSVTARILDAETSRDFGNNINWNFPGMIYVWTGNKSSVWNNKLNWDPASIPGKDSFVEIHDVSGSSGNFPECDLSVTVKKLLVDTDSSLDLNGNNLTVSGTAASSYVNKGTVKTKGTETVSLSASGTKDEDGNSTEQGIWNYYGGTIKAISNLSYNKIYVTASCGISGNVSAGELRILTGDCITCESNSVVDSYVYLGSEPAGFTFDNNGFSLSFEKSISTVTETGGTEYSLKFEGAGTTALQASISAKEILSNSPLSAAGIEFKSSGDQTYQSSVNLFSTTADSTFTVTNASSKIVFNDSLSGNASRKSVYFGSSTDASSTKTVCFHGNVSSLLQLFSYYKMELDASLADLSVAVASKAYFQKELILEGNNTVSISALSAESGMVILQEKISSKSGDSPSLDVSAKKTEFGTSGASITVSGLNELTVNGTLDAWVTEISTTGNQSFANLVLGDNIAFTTQSAVGDVKQVSFSGTVNGTFSLVSGSVSDCTKIVFGGIVGGTNPLSLIKCYGEADVNCSEIATSGNQLYYGDFVLGAASTLRSSSGNVQFASDVSGSAYSLSVQGGVYVSSASQISVKSLSVGTSGAERNLVISALEGGIQKPVKISCPVVVNGTFALLNGSLSFDGNASLKSSGDLIFLNTAGFGTLSDLYKDNAAGKVWRSGAENVFNYRGQFVLPEALPDTTVVSKTVFLSSVSGLGGKTLQAGKNFYCNGVDLISDSAWTLKACSNDGASSGFAEIFNANLSYCNYSSSNGGTSYLSAAEASDGGNNNANVCFSYPVIEYAKTVYDNVIKVSFVDSITGASIKIENSENEIWNDIALSSVYVTYGANSSSKVEFEGSYTDKECTVKTTGAGDISVFYLKTKTNFDWNTDATGLSSGDSQSTDMQGVHREAVPFLDIVRATAGQYKGLRDLHKNRVASYHSAVTDYSAVNSAWGATFTATTDECAPVLLAVRTGQEMHVDSGVGTQPCYDAHNFIEFQYSEEIDVNGNDSSAQNVRSSADFAGLSNNMSGVKAAGIAEFASGKISCGSVANGSGDVTVHSIYRNFSETISGGETAQTHRFRLGIAAYLNQTGAENPSGFNYWDGYIDSRNTMMISGVVSQISNGGAGINSLIQDKKGNSLLIAGTENHAIPTVAVVSSESEDFYYASWSDTVYGSWDLSSPEFAVYRSALSEGSTTESYEIIGACETDGSVLNRVEFHLFDNAANYVPSAMWYSQIGWTTSSQELFVPYSYGADVFGGARPFEYKNPSDSGRSTSGGIRYSSLYNKYSSFKYGTGSTPDTSFKSSVIKAGAVSSVYFPQTGSKRDTGSEDSLYFSIDLPDGSALPLKTTFSISYDQNGCVTDLAGNLLYSKEITSIDRVSPRFNISSVKVKGDKLYLVFNKEMNIKEVTLSYKDSARGTVTGCFADSLRFIQIPSSGHVFDSSADVVSDLYILRDVAPVVAYRASNATGLVFTLNRTVTLEDVRNYYIQCYSTEPGEFIDPVSGLANVNVTYVMDTSKNYMTHGEAHALSDFAIGVVNPVYAYDDRQTDDEYNLSIDQYKKGSYAVHDWNAEQKNFGTLMTNHDSFVVASLEDGEADTDDNLPEGAVMYLDNKPDADSVSVEYNKNLASSLRIWLPSKVVDGGTYSPVKEMPSLAPAVNDGALSVKGSLSEKQAKFDLKWKDLAAAGYASGNQVSFLFGLSDSAGVPETICHAPEYDEVTGIYTLDRQPLFAVRLKNPQDITSLDLWSFRLQGLTLQRGNVTILNNVINASQGESATVQVNLASEGALSVVVMTLDGNVVQYLQHGNASAGEHHYVWNGTTKSGKLVARGMYFVRVFGSGIDETRKVMVVKD